MKRLVLPLFALLFLIQPAFAQNLVQEAKDHLERNAFRYGLSAEDVADAIVTDAYASRRSGATHVYLRQSVDGIEVIGSEMTVNVDRDGRVFHTSGRMISSIHQRIRPQQPSLDARSAALQAASIVGIQSLPTLRVLESGLGSNRATTFSTNSVEDNPVRVKLVYKQDANDRYRLSWEVELALKAQGEYWLVYVDAVTGGEVARINLTVEESFGHSAENSSTSAATESFAPFESIEHALAVMAPTALVGSYRAFALPVESPDHSSPPLPADGRVLHVDPDDATASPFGWHDTDGMPGAESTLTTGNNVDAHKGATRPDGGGSLIFDNPADFSMSPVNFVDAAITNAFYLSNVFHDFMYHYGFDEVSGNFQENNYGNGGAGSDGINANVQASGNCNANFSTPSDGGNPTMNMFLCTTPDPDGDTDFDTGVLFHEITHGVSNRLTGGPANVGCLSNGEQMGEGWSDLYGLIPTMEVGDSRSDTRGLATYSLTNQGPDGPGIRLAPYDTDFADNDYTYGRTVPMVVVHEIGFVWATIIWEALWDLIDAYGFSPDVYDASGTAGNQVMLNLLTEGMKLQPCSPGFVTGRDAILDADVALYGGIHLDDLWAGFARRGLGVLADQGSSGTNTDNVEDFNVPESVPPDPITDLAASTASLGVELTWTATGDDGQTGTASSYDVRYSTSPITNDAEFDAAAEAIGEPDPQVSGSPESFVVTPLGFDTEYHFAIKVADEVFNISEISNPASATTNGAPALDVDTETIHVEQLPGSSSTRSLTITNTGSSDLTFSISFTETTAGPRVIATDEVRTPPINPEPEVKDGSEIPGVENQRGRGGPDAFGYSWIDSNEPFGPIYDWPDISGTGTPLNFSDDDSETAALPFTFEFYGVPKTDATISSNGYVTFGPLGTDFTNDPIPNATPPNDFIAPFWDDLDPGGGAGEVYYQDMGDGRFIVQWDDVPHFPGPGGNTYTFQLVLHQSGSMNFYYEAMDGILDSASIGIENAAANIGLQVINNAAYVEDGLAVRISDIWISANPGGGFVPIGGSEEVSLLFETVGLEKGTYTADLTLTTNDPEPSGTVVIPIEFVVTLNPTAEEPTSSPEGFPGTHLLGAAYPNPFNPQTAFTLAVAEAQNVRIEIYDALGRRAAVLYDGRMAGRTSYDFSVDGSQLASGAYFIRITGETFADMQRVTLLK